MPIQRTPPKSTAEQLSASFRAATPNNDNSNMADQQQTQTDPKKKKEDYIGLEEYGGFTFDDHMKLYIMKPIDRLKYVPGDFIPYKLDYRQIYLDKMQAEMKQAAGGYDPGLGASSNPNIAGTSKDTKPKVNLTTPSKKEIVLSSDDNDDDDSSDGDPSDDDPGEDDGDGHSRKRKNRTFNVTPNTRLPQMEKYVPVPDIFENQKKLRNYFDELTQWFRFLNITNPIRQKTATLLVGGTVFTDAYRFGTRIYPVGMNRDSPKEEKKKYAFVILKMTITKHLTTAEISVFFFRHQLNQEKQQKNESVVQFYYRLREKAFFCDFGSYEQTDERIFEIMLAGVREEKLRTKAFEDSMVLPEFLRYCQTIESARKQMASIQMRQVNNVERQNNTSKDDLPRCGFCNRKKHAKGVPCPSTGKKCNSCGQIGHFSGSRACANGKSSGGAPPSSQRPKKKGKGKRKSANAVNKGDAESEADVEDDDEEEDESSRTVLALTKHAFGV